MKSLYAKFLAALAEIGKDTIENTRLLFLFRPSFFSPYPKDDAQISTKQQYQGSIPLAPQVPREWEKMKGCVSDNVNVPQMGRTV